MNIGARLAILSLAFLPAAAMATNGYFAHGYGMKAKGMGGARTAMTFDAFGGASNPATMVWVGNRLDLGAEVFSPRREVERSGSTAFGGAYNGSARSDSNYFLIPEFGYNRMMSPDWSLGVTVYGNGGMNTDFDTDLAGPAFAPSCGGAPSNMLFGCGRLGVDMMQLIIAPTIAYKVGANHSIGIAPLFGYQRFEVDGLQAFDELGFSSSSGNVTNRGHDDATGWGVRVGWLGRLTETIAVGAGYSSKIRMSEFDDYRGLFAGRGDFDIPENYNIGIAIEATPDITVAFDIQRINYAGVRSIANGVTASLMNPMANPLGSSSGSGFKWRDQTVYKLGIEYRYRPAITLRAGFNYGKSPVRDDLDSLTFNIIAPGVVEKHLTLGMTWGLSDSSEISVAYMHAFEKTVTGPSATSLLGIGGTESLRMYQNSLGVAWGWKM